MDTQMQCNQLAARFEEMAAGGLLDVTFFVRNQDEATAESVCEELNRLYDAVDRGEEVPLDFRDATRS